ncbi:45227_t:CDS:2, partial [Gigaspora margarita]
MEEVKRKFMNDTPETIYEKLLKAKLKLHRRLKPEIYKYMHKFSFKPLLKESQRKYRLDRLHRQIESVIPNAAPNAFSSYPKVAQQSKNPPQTVDEPKIDVLMQTSGQNHVYTKSHTNYGISPIASIALPIQGFKRNTEDNIKTAKTVRTAETPREQCGEQYGEQYVEVFNRNTGDNI